MDVLFAVLPFADIHHPAIGVSLLHAKLLQLGIDSRVQYFNIDLAETIGADLFAWIAERSDQHLLDPSMPAVSLVGEWFFADTVFDTLPDEQEYIRTFLLSQSATLPHLKQLLEARQHRHAFIDHCVHQITQAGPKIVGFTTTFHQTCVCLSVARRLKQLPDPPIILFGGANCEGAMGQQMLASFPWIDFVCTGEGDLVVPPLVEALLREGRVEPPPGLLSQSATDRALSLPEPVRNMDTLPIPDYRDYFARIQSASVANDAQPRLLLESSRGCWWGEKQHCTFCGLNGETMSYRSKSATRVLREIDELTTRYGVQRVDTVDNILDLQYLKTLFPTLAERAPGLHLFYETKANLRFSQMRLLRQAGVRSLQPGIESLSNQVLRLMRKGCTGLMNIQFLRWAEELGMEVVWNLIYGFPGELPAEYARMAEMIPLLTHLQTPSFCVRVRMDRFSPLYAGGDEVGLIRRRPMPAYSFVFPLEADALANLAYFFEFDYADGRNPSSYATQLIDSVNTWSQEAIRDRPRLDLFSASDFVLVTDTRACAVRGTHLLEGLAARILLECDSAQSVNGLARTLAALPAEILGHLQSLIDLRLVVCMDDQYLSLPVIGNRSACAPANAHPVALPILQSA